MRRDKRWLYALALGAAILLPASAFAAEECVIDHSWECDDDPNSTCTGQFDGSYTEDASSKELHQVIRFTPIISGTHKLRMAGVAEDFNGAPSSDEEFQAFTRQAAGCGNSGIYVSINTFDDSCCEDVTDYNLGYTSTTDICLLVESNEVDADRDKLVVEHAEGEDHPALVTSLPNDNWPDSENTTLGVCLVCDVTLVGRCTPGDVEELQESGFQHRLWHAYTIQNVPSGSAQTLNVGGYRVGDDNENFNIMYKWSSTCTGTTGWSSSGITISSTTDTDYSAGISNSSGTLCVAVDDASGGSENDTAYIDHVYVVTTP